MALPNKKIKQAKASQQDRSASKPQRSLLLWSQVYYY